MRESSTPWPDGVPDRALAALAALGGVVFLALAAGNPVPLGDLLGLQLAFTPDRWTDGLAGGVTAGDVRDHLVRDVFGMMPAYTVALTTLFTALWRRARAAGSARAEALRRSAWLALAVFVFDLVEGAGMWLAAGSERPPAALVFGTSLVAAAKWGTLLYALLAPAMAGRRGSAAA